MSQSSVNMISARKKALIEFFFKKHGYSGQDIDDFFDTDRMDRRFAEELKAIRAERAKQNSGPVLTLCQLETCTD